MNGKDKFNRMVMISQVSLKRYQIIKIAVAFQVLNPLGGRVGVHFNDLIQSLQKQWHGIGNRQPMLHPTKRHPELGERPTVGWIV